MAVVETTFGTLSGLALVDRVRESAVVGADRVASGGPSMVSSVASRSSLESN